MVVEEVEAVRLGFRRTWCTEWRGCWLGGESAFFREHSSDSEFYLDVDLGKEEEVDIFTERLKGLVM